MGRLKYEAKRPDVLLSDELPDSLRALPVEGSLLHDRFESLQARNLIEVRKRAPRQRKAKRKAVLREAFKDKRFKSPFGSVETPAWM